MPTTYRTRGSRRTFSLGFAVGFVVAFPTIGLALAVVDLIGAWLS